VSFDANIITCAITHLTVNRTETARTVH